MEELPFSKIDNENFNASSFKENHKSHKKKFIQGTFGKISQNSDGTITKEIKKFRKDKMLESTSIKEISFASSVFHKNIIEINSINSKDKIFEIVEEYGGITITEWCNDTTLDERKKTLPFIIFQILDILILLEHINIIHGDIKPRNILIEPSTSIIKVIDFGGVHFDSRIIQESNVHKLFANCTYLFSSPEMLAMSNKDITKKPSLTTKHDIFSLGLVIKYILSTNQERDDNKDDTFVLDLYKSSKKVYPLPGYLSERIDGNILELVKFMLVIDYKQRPPASQLVYHKSLEALISEIALQSPKDQTKFDTNLLNYFSNNPIFTPSIRQQFVEWIFDICDHFGLVQISLLSLSLFDKTLYLFKNMTIDGAHIVACSCILIADALINSGQILFEEILKLVDKKFNLEQLISTIDKIIKIMDYNLYERTFDYYIRENSVRVNYNIIESISKDIHNISKSSQELYAIYMAKISKSPSLPKVRDLSEKYKND